jgi:Ran GTPase-activating protein (RanGAP) involved in mRNA processing and transport
MLPPMLSDNTRGVLPMATTFCILDICPWDCLGCYLTLTEMGWIAGVSISLRSKHTLVNDSCVGRKLLAPLLPLRHKTAISVLKRISLPHVCEICVAGNRCMRLLRRELSDMGGPVALRSLRHLSMIRCAMDEDVIGSFFRLPFSHTKLRHLRLTHCWMTDDLLCSLVAFDALAAGSMESLDLQYNFIGNRGIGALASSPVCDKLKWLDLQNNRIGDDGVVVFARFLQSNTSILVLNLQRQNPPLTDRAALALSEALQENRALELLVLNINVVGDAGAKALNNGIHRHLDKLRTFNAREPRFTLELEYNCITEYGAVDFCRSLDDWTDAHSVAMLLQGNQISLDLEGVSLTDYCGLPVSVSCGKLYGSYLCIADRILYRPSGRQHNSMQRCVLDRDVIGGFIGPMHFGSTTGLRHLNLQHSCITDDLLCVLVASHALVTGSLGSLNLRYNLVGDQGIEAMVSSPICTNLHRIDLETNRVGDDGIDALARILRSNTSLEHLNLTRQKPPLTDRAAIALAGALKENCVMTILSLQLNAVGNVGAKALSECFVRHIENLEASYTGLGFDLDLSHNYITEPGAADFVRSPEGWPSYYRRNIFLYGNPVDHRPVDGSIWREHWTRHAYNIVSYRGALGHIWFSDQIATVPPFSQRMR